MNDVPLRGELYLLPRIERALDLAGRTHDWADVVPRLLDGRAQYWESDDGRGVVITEILRYPKLNAVNYWIGAGRLQSCLELVPVVERWARGEGCSRAIGMGREGFARLLGPTGVEIAGYAYRKELAP